jgi:hypothetical protein
MTSREWPTAAIFTSAQSSDNGMTYTPVCLNVAGGLGGLGADPSVLTLMLSFTKAPEETPPEMVAKNQTLVMLSSPAYPRQFIYLSSMGYGAAMYQNDPGAGGYWYIKTLTSQPLPMSVQNAMPAYFGPRCSSFCGVAQAKAHSAQTLGLSAILAVIAALALSLQL